MGALPGHVYEAEHSFEEDVSADEVREQIIALLKSTQQYEHIESDKAATTLFRRTGEVNDLKYAYPVDSQGYTCDKQKTVYGIHVTTNMGYKDDMAFTFSTKDGKLMVKTLSLSRVGESDWGQNGKNIAGIMDQLKYKRAVNVIRDTNKTAIRKNQ